MRDVEFPVFKTKVEGIDKKFDLMDPKGREEYFQAKAGDEISRLRNYLKENTFVVYLLGKKNSGKGTYAKMFKEIIDKDKIEHFSVGDAVRELDAIVRDKDKKKELEAFLAKNYRGYMPLSEIMAALESRSTTVLLPSELILALLKMKLAVAGKKALFIDGFPRSMDQVSYSLFFRDLIGYRDDPDVFAMIDIPEAVIDERIKYRAVCPKCQTSRNVKLLPTKNVGFDEKEGKFYLFCDNSQCTGERMTGKEGDEQGIGPIRDRLTVDEELIKKAFTLHGVPKVLLRNSVPVNLAKDSVDDYEITPEYYYQKEGNEIKILEKPWQVLDDEGVASYSLLAAPVVLALIKQMVEALDI
ncbi:MAG: nucleoside monophosphate kinase [Candidatus Gribaldobacteria bacterium]|nr:nucleoside monophosphate kinase [Candidatus Gribaldobacteria bacterium]